MSKNEQISILLVEDDMEDSNNIKNYINTKENVKLIGTFNSAKDALKNIKIYIPDAIILDIELNNGEGSGLEILEKINEMDLEVNPIIVITTNISSKTVYSYAHEKGADLNFTN